MQKVVPGPLKKVQNRSKAVYMLSRSWAAHALAVKSWEVLNQYFSTAQQTKPSPKRLSGEKVWQG